MKFFFLYNTTKNGFTEISKILETDQTSIPPDYQKLCSVVKKKASEIILQMKNWPKYVMVDGCSINVSGKIVHISWHFSPNLRCVLHAADSSIKRKTNSKTMNIQELSDFLPSFQSVLRHVQLSEKRTVMLNDVIEMLDIMWFCPTRILFSYILFAG